MRDHGPLLAGRGKQAPHAASSGFQLDLLCTLELLPIRGPASVAKNVFHKAFSLPAPKIRALQIYNSRT